MADDTKTQLIAFDLSLTNSGYVVGEVQDNKLTILEVGSISTIRFTRHGHGFRLNYIADEVSKIYRRYPDADAVIKEGSFSRFVKATQAIYKVVGVWELVTHLRGHDEFTDLAPSSVKKSVTGKGNSNKEKVAKAVKDLTGISPANNDESDAIAVLLTYCEIEKLIELDTVKVVDKRK